MSTHSPQDGMEDNLVDTNQPPPEDGGSVTGSNEDAFGAMMRGLHNELRNTEDEEDDPEILKAFEDVEECEDFGPSLVNHVADAYTKTVSRLLSKETSDNLRKGIKIPENCKSLRVPKVNPEIWQHMRTRPRLTDIKYQQVQASLSTAHVTLASMSNEIAIASRQMPKELVSKLLKMGMDGANLIGNQMQELSTRRRQEIKLCLNPEYAGICNTKIPTGEFLFGDNINETLKTTKATASIARNVGSNKHRYQPYPSTQRPSSSLNFYRPSTSSSTRGRWNGPQRNVSNNFQYGRQGPPTNNFQKNQPIIRPNYFKPRRP